MELSPIPPSLPVSQGKPSLCNFPAEIRLEIWTNLLSLLNTPTYHSYTHTGPIPPTDHRHANQAVFSAQHPKSETYKHSVLLVSQQFSHEYRQCFYERTTFFLRVDAMNAFLGVPELNGEQPPWAMETVIDNNKGLGTGIPRFWGDSDALLRNVRHCTLFIELGAVASKNMDSYGESGFLNMVVAVERWNFFDTTIVDSILRVLHSMQQLRSISLVWAVGTSARFLFRSSVWDRFGKPSEEVLKEKKSVVECKVKVGNQFQETVWSGKREKGVWKGTWEIYEDTAALGAFREESSTSWL
jgi:hypothetical protein